MRQNQWQRESERGGPEREAGGEREGGGGGGAGGLRVLCFFFVVLAGRRARLALRVACTHVLVRIFDLIFPQSCSHACNTTLPKKHQQACHRTMQASLRTTRTFASQASACLELVLERTELLELTQSMQEGMHFFLTHLEEDTCSKYKGVHRVAYAS